MRCVALLVERYLKAELLEQTNYIENFFDSKNQKIIKTKKILEFQFPILSTYWWDSGGSCQILEISSSQIGWECFNEF